MKNTETQFYKEIKNTISNYMDSFTAALTKEDRGLIWSNFQKDYVNLRGKLNENDIKSLERIVKEICVGVAHSLLVSIDGGTALSNNGKALDLVEHKTKKSITEGALHENFMEVVLDEKSGQ